MLGKPLVDRFYDGGLFACYRIGRKKVNENPDWLTPMVEKHINRNLAGMLCGAWTDRFYSRNLLKILTTYGIDPKERELLAIG